MRFSSIELKDLLKAWLAISLAFAIVLGGLSKAFLSIFILAALTVGVGFIFHELAHKLMAQRYGCFAEFRSFDNMLILAIALSFLGFVFAAPGAVMIRGYIDNKKNGKISAAGAIANLLVAFLFLIVYFIAVNDYMALIGKYGIMINSWLALFNMIPFWNFDGKKVLQWNKAVYTFIIILAVVFMVVQGLI